MLRNRVVLVVVFIACLALVLSGVLAQRRVASQGAVPTACSSDPGGWIGAVWEAYGGRISYGLPGALGLPLGPECALSPYLPGNYGVCVPLATCYQDTDKYQRFANGTIYYNSEEKAAFAMFGALDDYYFPIRQQLGLPISSEINPPRVHEPCLGVFQKGYLKCTAPGVIGDLQFWTSFPTDDKTLLDALLPVPQLQLPYPSGQSRWYTGGPHAFESVVSAGDTYPVGDGSGIDLADGDWVVYTVAPGTVIRKYMSPNGKCEHEDPGFGCWVAIRHDFSGTVMIYGHIEPSADVVVGHHLAQGMPIGRTTTVAIGITSTGGPHLHLELRSGTGPIADRDKPSDYGQPIDWHLRSIGNYTIAGYSKLDDPDTRYSYDGVALVNHDTSAGEVEIRYWDQGTFMRAASYLTPDAALLCDQLPDNKSCEEIPASSGTIFAAHGELVAGSSAQSIETMAESAGILVSSSTVLPYEPQYMPPYPGGPVPTATVPVGSNCPTDGRDGVYFYGVHDYQLPCYYTVNDVPDFGTTIVGNDAVSSIRVIGEWKVKLWEDRNFSGRYEYVSHDDNNLDESSLGEQYSSAQIFDTRSDCPDDGREGVYMYTDRNYDGQCTFATDDVMYFGDTVIGNDTLSSIRMVGYWNTRIYEDPNLGGRYTFVGHDDPDLEITSLGGQYSSIEIWATDPPAPTVTPTPTATPAPVSVTLLSPTMNNGGFETGSFAGWLASGGTFTIASDEPHSGTKYVKGTSATTATLYRSFGLGDYRQMIDEQRGSAFASVWIHAGNSEWYSYTLQFLDAGGGTLWKHETGWQRTSGSYDPIGATCPAIPAGSASVRLSVQVKRTTGDYTDVDLDDFALVLQFGPATQPTPTATPVPPTPTPTPVGTPAPSCAGANPTALVLYDWAYCDSADGSWAYGTLQTLVNLQDLGWGDRASALALPIGWSALVYSGPDGTGYRRCVSATMPDLSLEQYDGGGATLANTISSLVVYDEPGCPIYGSSSLSFPTSIQAGEVVTASFTVVNQSGAAMPLDYVLMGVHGPYCDSWDCPNILDFPNVPDVVIPAGGSYLYSARRAFNTVDDGYLWHALTVDANGLWHGHNDPTTFEVTPGLTVASALELSPAEPVEGLPVTAQYTVRNDGTQTIFVRRLGVVARGPECTNWEGCDDRNVDWPVVENISLAPGESYHYSRTRPLGLAGDGYIADAAFADDNVWWYTLPGNTRVHFQVSEPACSAWAEGTVTLFDRAFCDAGAGTFSYGLLRSLRNLSEVGWDNDASSIAMPSGWSVRVFSDASGAGHTRCLTGSMPDLSLEAYDGGGLMMGNTISSLVVYDEPDCPKFGVSEVSFPSSILAGDMVTATFTMVNRSGLFQTLDYVIMGARGPGCSSWSECPWELDFPDRLDVMMWPGETYRYTAHRAFNTVGEGYYYHAVTLDANGIWQAHNLPTPFTVETGLTMAHGLELSPAQPVEGVPLTARYRVRNDGTRTIHIPRLGVISRGPGCTSWSGCDDRNVDWPVVEDITLAPGAWYDYEQTRLPGPAGDAYIADATFADDNVWWYTLPGNARVTFAVEAAIDLVSPLTLIPSNPIAGESVVARFSVRNTSTQPITLVRLGVGGRGPGADDWDDQPVEDFPWQEPITLEPGQTHPFEEERSYSYEGSYFAQAMFDTVDGGWVRLGEQVDFSVSTGLQVVHGLTLSPAEPFAGQPVTARYTVRNAGTRAIALGSLSVTARGPGCADMSCPRDVGYGGRDDITLEPGAEYTYEGTRGFADVGDGYLAMPIFQALNGWWIPISQGTIVPFTVGQRLAVITPLSLSPAQPIVGEAVTATFTIRNLSPTAISLDSLTAGLRGPDCSDWSCERGFDFGQEVNVVIPAGAPYTYTRAAALREPGDGYFAQISYQVEPGMPWVRLGDHTTFSVGAGLTMHEPLTITPMTPQPGQSATARFTVRNAGTRALVLTGLGVVSRKDNCSGWECDPHLDFPPSTPVTIAPGGTHTYSASRMFSDLGGYFADPAFIDTNYWWLPVPGSSRMTFEVSSSTCPVYAAQSSGSVDERPAAGSGPACVTLEFTDSGVFSISSGWVYTSPLTLDSLVVPTEMRTGELAPQILPYSRAIVASSADPLRLHFVATDLASGSEIGFSYTFTTDEPPPPCGSGVVPTYLYADAYGLASTLDGNPIPAGSCILAYDPDGVLCGAAVVSVPGQWGVMHIYGDDPGTPVDEGALSGDSIRFTVAGKPTQTGVPVAWYDRHRLLVELSATSQVHRDIPLLVGWNLFSFDLEPRQDGTPLSVPQDVLSTIDGFYTAVLGYDQGARSYYPDLPDYMNDLDAVDHHFGYWIRMTEAHTLALEGAPVAADQPLSLDPGWNLVSYLPAAEIPVPDALASLGTNLQAVLAFHDGAARSFYPDLPDYMNDLQCLRPSHGYWVKVATADTLTYPLTGSCSATAALAQSAQKTSALSITPTRLWCEVYSLDSQCGGTDLPPGTVVRAYDPEGVLCGEIIVQVAGEWGTMHVYGNDPDTPEDEGAESGDLLSFTVNGQPASASAPVTWEDRALRQVSLVSSSCGFKLFLPMVLR